MKHLLSAMLFSLLLQVVNAQQLLRGPYLQKKTSSSINIKWRTDVPANSKVYYGTDINNLSLSASNASFVTNHEVVVSGLQPNTQYFYKVESNNTILSSGNNHYFKTAPVSGTVQPIRIWAVGDFGKGNDGQRKTRDAYINYTQNTPTDVWLWLGDNAYQDGTDQEFQDKVFDSTNSYGNIMKYMDFYPTPGNHDYNSICGVPCGQNPDIHSGAYYDIVSVPTNGEAGGVPSGREHYYSFDYGNVHIATINSELGSFNANHDWTGALSSNGDQISPMLQWLKDDLAANTLPWTIVVWHQPPYSKGSHDSDDAFELFMKAMREHFVPVIEQYGVDVVLNGHSHVYERSYLLKGHTGTSETFDPLVHLVNGTSGNENLGEAYVKYTDGDEPNKGTVYVVSGNGGSKTDDPEFPHPVMFFSDGGDTAYGSFVIDVVGNKFNGKYLTAYGEIKDQFTIEKKSVTGIKNDYSFFDNIQKVKVTPNPFQSEATIEYEVVKPTTIQVALYSLDGKMIYELYNAFQNNGKQQIKIDAEQLQLSSGKYIIKITNGKAASYEKVIKLQ